MSGPALKTLSRPAGAGSLWGCANGLQPFPSLLLLLLLPVSGAVQGELVPHLQLPLLTLRAFLPQTSPPLPLPQDASCGITCLLA